MERRAESNRFAIFLFCLLVPLGSFAPTEISKESKITTGQKQEHFTTPIQSLASMIEQEASELLKFYRNCVAAVFHPETWNTSKAKDLAKKIPKCPVFHANCCAFHHIHYILKILASDIETICNETSKVVVEENINQLNTTLSEGAAFYTCGNEDLSQLYPQGRSMSLAEREIYIWGVLNIYKEIMQNTSALFSTAR